MQRIAGSLLASQVIVLLFVGSYAWSHNDDYDSMKRLMYSYGTYKRLPSYDFGLGKRSMEEAASYEDLSSGPSSSLTSSPAELYYANQWNNEDKRSPKNMYSFGLGKRNRAYGFGLGKRLEQAWKSSATHLPSYSRQERRSKIYSFGLGKRSNLDGAENVDYYDAQQQQQLNDKRAGRQFSFGLGKREAVDTNQQQQQQKSAPATTTS